jgi:bifunctional enzyme CysN/CysC
MATAASRADLAVILVDARHGIVRQTRRHAAIVGLMGIRQVVLAVTKMDLVDFDQAMFDRVVEGFAPIAAEFGFAAPVALPLSGLTGDNVARRSTRTPWHQGPTLLAALEASEAAAAPSGPGRLAVQRIVRVDPDFRGYAGMMAGGALAVGAAVTVQPANRTTRISRIVTFDGDREVAAPGQSVTLCLADAIDVPRGSLIAAADRPATVAEQFAAKLIWMDDEPLYPGRFYRIQFAAAAANAMVAEIKGVIDVDTLAEHPAASLGLNDIGLVKLAADQPLAFDLYDENRNTGGFVLIDRMTCRTVGAGLVQHALRRGQFVSWQSFDVRRQDRAALKGQRPAVIWLTGLSGAGKSTIANLLERKLTARGRHCYVLDGDNVRHGLNRDLGFTAEDRVENVRRVAEVARLMADAGLIVVVSLISPYARERMMAREIAGGIDFLEVFIDAPLAICESRDPKGLYRKAREGILVNFTGVDAPYEAPTEADLVLDTSGSTPDALADALIGRLAKSGII